MSLREPLTPEERALAQRLREWSVAAPSSDLDRRVLAQAQAAAVAPQRQGRPWLVGLASAASLVFAVGLIWRVLQEPAADAVMTPPASPQMRASPSVDNAGTRDLGTSAPAAATVPVDTSEPEQGQLDRIEVTGSRIASPAASEETRKEPAASKPASPPAGSAPQAFPTPGYDESERRLEQAPVMNAPSSPPVELSMPEMLPAPAPAPAPAAPPPPVMPPEPAAAPLAAEAAERDEQLQDRAREGEASAGSADASKLGATRSDAETDLDFSAAVAEIRALIERGERERARAALKQLRQRYPQQSLPADLRRFERSRRSR